MNIDARLAKFGFIKISELQTSCHYERYNPEFRCYQTVYISYKSSWHEFRMQMYDEEFMDKETSKQHHVSLGVKELELFTQKLKHMQSRYRKHLKFFGKDL